MINNVGEQLFAILDEDNGTISSKDICGMVGFNQLSIIFSMLVSSRPLEVLVLIKARDCMIGP